MKRDSQQGSALVTTIIITAIVALLMATYLKTTLHDANHTDRVYMYDTALDIAESATEDAVDALNQGDFSDWTNEGNGRFTKTVDDLQLSNGKLGSYQIVLQTNNTDDDVVLTIEGDVNSPIRSKMERQVVVKLTPRGVFGNGLVAIDKQDLGSHDFMVTGYNSNDGDHTTSIVDSCTVACESAEDDTMLLGSGEIYGIVATGGAAPSYDQSAKIYGSDSAEDLDQSRIHDDYFVNLPPIESPSITFGASEDALPAAIQSTISIGGAYGDTFELSSLSVADSETLVIDGDVTIIVDGDAEILGDVLFQDGSSVKLYVSGDLTIAGDVDMTDVQAGDFQVYGTSTVPGEKTLTFNHLGILKIAVLAPQHNIVLEKGTPNTAGTGGGDDGDDDSESTDDDSESTDDDSESTDDDSESTDDDSESTDDDSESTDDDSESTDDDSESTDEDSESSDDDSESSDEDSESSDEDSESSDDDSESSDDDSESSDDDSESSDDDSESSDDDSESSDDDSESSDDDSESSDEDSESSDEDSESSDDDSSSED